MFQLKKCKKKKNKKKKKNANVQKHPSFFYHEMKKRCLYQSRTQQRKKFVPDCAQVKRQYFFKADFSRLLLIKIDEMTKNNFFYRFFFKYKKCIAF